MTEDWSEILNGQPSPISLMQVATIESLLHFTSISREEQEDILDSLDALTEMDAEKIIIRIKENKIPIDPKDQFKQMFNKFKL